MSQGALSINVMKKGRKHTDQQHKLDKIVIVDYRKIEIATQNNISIILVFQMGYKPLARYPRNAQQQC